MSIENEILKMFWCPENDCEIVLELKNALVRKYKKLGKMSELKAVENKYRLSTEGIPDYVVNVGVTYTSDK
jgi:hypothetical protein